jgi:hypothetical protein
MEANDLNRQLNRLIAGTIEADDFARLQEVLKADPEARQAYYDLLGVDMMLAERYETPDYITVHSQAMDNSWAVRRARRGMVAWSLAGAAAVLMITLATFFFLRTRPLEVTLNASGDSHFSINGHVRTDGLLARGDTLEISHGVVSLALGPFVEACVEGPARVRLHEEDGGFELQQGAAFFQVSPGGKDFRVRTPAGTIYDIGTKFGVHALPDGQIETHVTAGAVEIQPPGGGPRHRVDAGNAVRWAAGTDFRPAPIDADRFVQNLPWQTVVFKDDFSDEDGTPLSGKEPGFGQPWMVLMETNPTQIRRGLLDTSFGPRNLSAGFRVDPSNGRRRVYMMTFATAVPENVDDKEGYVDASESITLWDSGGKALFSIVAHKSRDHHWQLKDEATGTVSTGTGISALEANTLTLCYEHDTGLVRLYQGPSPRGTLLDEMQVRSSATPRSLTVSNIGGGDLALDHLEARVVTYPQTSKSGN